MIIFLILLAALIVRLINLNQSLWFDEAINVVYSQKYNFWDFLTVYSLGDFHPPLHFAILWVWTRIFGTSEIAVRMPSVIFGVLTVWFTYLTGKKIFNIKTGLIAAAILALNPLHIYYSQEARMYSLAAFSVAFSFWALINLLKGKKYFVLIYGLSVLIILYSDYLVYLALVAQFIYVGWLEKKKLTKFLIGELTLGIFWIPWLFIFPYQLKTGQAAAIQIPGWANVVGGANFKELGLVAVKSIIGRVSFDNKYLYAAVVVPLLILYGFISIKAVKELTKEIKLLLLWILAPVLLAFVVSFYIPIFTYFRMIFILPGLAILISHGINKFKSKYRQAVLVIVLAISFIFNVTYYLNPKFQREDWKNAVKFVNESGSLVLFEDSNIPAPARYYGCVKNCLGALKNFPAKTEADLTEFESLISNTTRVTLFDYLVEISDPQKKVAEKLERLGFKNTVTRDFNGVGFVYEYSK